MVNSSRILAFAVALALLASYGCTGPTGNTNVNVNTNANTSPFQAANSNSSAAGAGSLEAREPESYSTTMTLTGQYAGGQRQGNLPTLQFEFARMDDDRRWSFNLPQPIGEVIYLDKDNLKYLLIPARNQYVELRPEELGFRLGDVMTPVSIIEQLKSRGQHEILGTEPVNGRPAIKHRFAGAADTRTGAGSIEADSFVYVDQQTGLPLRSEVNFTSDRGDTARLVTETRDIQLNPQPSLFEIPTNMRKVTTQELKQQVDSFINAIRIFGEMMRRESATAPPPQAAANANR
jgi:hypothetical protein